MRVISGEPTTLLIEEMDRKIAYACRRGEEIHFIELTPAEYQLVRVRLEESSRMVGQIGYKEPQIVTHIRYKQYSVRVIGMLCE